MTETIEILGQEWHVCPFAWGIDDYIVIDPTYGPRLILMQKEKWRSEDSGGVRFVPVLASNLPEYKGSNNE